MTLVIGFKLPCYCSMKTRKYKLPAASYVKQEKRDRLSSLSFEGDGDPGRPGPICGFEPGRALGLRPTRPLDASLHVRLFGDPPGACRARLRELPRVPVGRTSPVDRDPGRDLPLGVGADRQRGDGQEDRL